MAEGIFTPIPWAPGYMVSRSGTVFSNRTGKLRKLAPWLNSKGYEVVSLRFSDGSRSRALVHRTIARVFNGEPQRGQECRHLDGDKRNNRPNNLEWGTHSENMTDTVRHGTHISVAKPERIARGDRHGSRTKPGRVPRGESSGTAKITEAQAREILMRALRGETISGIARSLAVPRGATKCVVQRKTWKHLEATEKSA